MKRLFALSCFLISILLYGQEPSPEKPYNTQLPIASPGSWLTRPLPRSEIKNTSPQQTVTETKPPRRDSAATSSGSRNDEAQPGPRRITLEEAEQQAASSADPMMKLGQLQIEAAKQHRLGAESDYFPKIGSTLTNFHFNKFMGQLITVQRPIVGGTSILSLPLAGKDQTLVAATAAQPLTPLFKLHQVVNLARADERIAEARAKAGLPPQTASAIEENYYKLLVAQRELTIAKDNEGNLEARGLVASNASPPVRSGDKEDELEDAANAVAEADIKVQELTSSLNQLLGWPPDTELELVPPEPPLADISLQEATDKAMVANVEVVTAEQNLAKARAASSLAKLDYIPDAVVMGGYAYNSNAIPLLPRDFSFVGLIGSYTLFDFGKREHTIKERKAQVEMAELGVQLTRAKVSAGVKSSYLELERARQMSALRHRMVAASQLRNAKMNDETQYNPRLSSTKAEAEMFEADLSYRKAITRLQEKISGSIDNRDDDR
jgi:outer membrane protein TolC